jgi:hypothetical protein
MSAYHICITSVLLNASSLSISWVFKPNDWSLFLCGGGFFLWFVAIASHLIETKRLEEPAE